MSTRQTIAAAKLAREIASVVRGSLRPAEIEHLNRRNAGREAGDSLTDALHEVQEDAWKFIAHAWRRAFPQTRLEAGNPQHEIVYEAAWQLARKHEYNPNQIPCPAN